MKKLALGLLLLLVLGAAIVAAIPALREPLLARLAPPTLVHGRPVSEWLIAIQSSKADERREAALALGECPSIQGKADAARADYATVFGALAGALDDPEPFVRKCAASSLLMIPRDNLVVQDRPSVAQLNTYLGDSQALVRRFAARAVGRIGEPAAAAVPVLTERLQDTDDSVREEAARALGKIGPKAQSAVPALLDRLKNDDDIEVRELAAKGMRLIGWEAFEGRGEDVVTGLRQALKDTESPVRAHAVQSLGQFGAHAKAAIPDLLVVWKEKDEAIRALAATALLKIDADAARKAGVR